MTGHAADPASAPTSSRPRVLHITTIDMSLALLLGPQLAAFAEAGYEVIGASAPGPFVERLADFGVRHVPFRHATRRMSITRDARFIRELSSLCKELRPEIVHTHTPKPNYYGRPVARRAGVPVVVNTVHGLLVVPEDRWTKRWFVYGLERWASRFSDAELVQNPEDLQTLQRVGVDPGKLHLLGNGVDLDRFHPSRLSAERAAALRREIGAGPTDVVCGTVARLVWEKGFRELFAAAGELRESHPNVRFVVIGPHEPDKADAVPTSAVERARRLGISFLGHRDDVEDLYRAIDIFVLPTYREGFPRAVMEAAAMGLPVVATEIRGCRQAIDDGVTGRLVAPVTVEPLVQAIAELVDDPARREMMGHAARRKAEREFDQRQQIDVTLGIYEHLLGSQPEPSRRPATR